MGPAVPTDDRPVTSLPIGDYALLSDCHGSALISRDGSVDWLCFQRFDAPSVFARILDPGAGPFSIRPAGAFEVSRAYAGQTMVLRTTFVTPSGSAVQLGADDRVAAWTAVAKEIRMVILERGWSDQADAFAQAFGSDDLDASCLMLAITGFLPADDPSDQVHDRRDPGPAH